MVKTQAKTTAFSFTAKIPITQVTPSNGKSTQAAFAKDLSKIINMKMQHTFTISYICTIPSCIKL